MRIVFTNGGTGGHIFPIIAVARQLKKIYGGAEPLEMFFVGSDDGYREVLSEDGIAVKLIFTGKLRRYFSLWTVLDILKIPIGLIQSFWHLYALMPDVVFSKGGYGGLCPVFVAWLYRIPVLSHESDAVPGLANRIGAIFSKRLAVSFQSAERYFSKKKTALVGNPIRLKLVQSCLSDNPGEREKAQSAFNIASQKPVIFILGGSQGAEKINQLVLSVLPDLLDKYEVIHQCGARNYAGVRGLIRELPANYHLFPFLNEFQMASAYFLSDLVISRVGDGSIFEISSCAKPSILIPIPKSPSDNQRKNAFAYARAGATSVLEQDNITPHLLLSEISEILDNPAATQKMRENAKSFSRLEAADNIARALIEMGRQ